MSHVHDVESGLMGLKRTAKDDTVVRVKCLKSYIEEIINKEHFNLVESDIFNNKIWLLFSGEKGRNHMKFNAEMVNSNIAGSVDNVHIYCMFEATDSPENMCKVWLPYHDQIKEFQKEGYSISCKEFKVFLGGDYHFLDDNMGHQGSSASFPSAMDKTSLGHLQNHGGLPHTPQSCPVQQRTIDDYVVQYNANLMDQTNNGDMRKNGSKHYSVIAPMLFPLKSLDQVVPSVLNIKLGIVLLLYNLLLQKCKEIDMEENAEKLSANQQKIDEEWEIVSIELAQNNKSLQQHSEHVIEMENFINQHKAALSGNLENQSNNKCDAINCFSTNKDFVNFVSCDRTYHPKCECIADAYSISAEQVYCCLCCSEVEDIARLLNQKISDLLDEEDLLKKTILSTILCDNLKAKYNRIIGLREKMLNAALEV